MKDYTGGGGYDGVIPTLNAPAATSYEPKNTLDKAALVNALGPALGALAAYLAGGKYGGVAAGSYASALTQQQQIMEQKKQNEAAQKRQAWADEMTKIEFERQQKLNEIADKEAEARRAREASEVEWGIRELGPYATTQEGSRDYVGQPWGEVIQGANPVAKTLSDRLKYGGYDANVLNDTTEFLMNPPVSAAATPEQAAAQVSAYAQSLYGFYSEKNPHKVGFLDPSMSFEQLLKLESAADSWEEQNNPENMKYKQNMVDTNYKVAQTGNIYADNDRADRAAAGGGGTAAIPSTPSSLASGTSSKFTPKQYTSTQKTALKNQLQARLWQYKVPARDAYGDLKNPAIREVIISNFGQAYYDSLVKRITEAPFVSEYGENVTNSNYKEGTPSPIRTYLEDAGLLPKTMKKTQPQPSPNVQPKTSYSTAELTKIIGNAVHPTSKQKGSFEGAMYDAMKSKNLALINALMARWDKLHPNEKRGSSYWTTWFTKIYKG